VAIAFERHQDRIREAQRRRLEALELQAATHGIDTPPHVATEIEDLRGQLAGVAVVEPLNDEERHRATMRAVMLLSQQLAAIEIKVERLCWLLPAILFAYLVLSFILEHL
jgi:hypothetical protein